MNAPAELPDPRAYLQMADEIRQAIKDGTLKRGDPAPSVTALSRQTGHARQTCSRALRILEAEGLVTRFAGLGYFVCATPPAQPHDTTPQKEPQ